MTAEGPIAQMLEEHALRQLVMRYSRAIDRHDWEAMRGIFHDNATVDYGFYAGPVAGFLEALPRALGIYVRHLHSVVNGLYVVEGDRGEGESYLAANAQTAAPEAQHHAFGGRYLDRFEKRDGVWRILERTVVHDWLTVTPLADATVETFQAIGLTGRYDRTDASYARLPLLQNRKS